MAKAKNTEMSSSEQKETFIEEGTVATSKSLTWLKRPDWQLSFKGNNTAVILGVSDEDFELLQKDDNKGFAEEVVEWVANNAGKKNISRYEIKGGLYNIGRRGPGTTMPFKLREAKKRNTNKEVKTIVREPTSQEIIDFIFSGKLDASAFVEALEEKRRQRAAEIERLRNEMAEFDSWEKLVAHGKPIGG